MSTSDHLHRQTSPNAQDDQRQEALEQYVENRAAFRAHAAVFAGGMTAIFLVNLFINLAAGTTGQWGAWWSAWALLGWGLGVSVHGFVVWLSRPSRP